MRIALYQPDIPQNAGTILRLCACLGLDAEVILPSGFDFSGRALRRAGLDYLSGLAIRRHEDFAAFERDRLAQGARFLLLTTSGETPYCDFDYRETDIVMAGRESGGAAPEVHAAADARLRIPMRAGKRSLNVAVAVAMVVGEALRQTGGFRSFA